MHIQAISNKLDPLPGNQREPMTLRPVDPTRLGKTTRLYALHRGDIWVWYAPLISRSYLSNPHTRLILPTPLIFKSPLYQASSRSPLSPLLRLTHLPPLFSLHQRPSATHRCISSIQPTITEGKTMREAAGGRSAWIRDFGLLSNLFITILTCFH